MSMLEDKVIVVTGAGRGIGRAVAMAAAEAGAAVIVNDLGADLGGEGGDPSHAQQTVADIEAAGGRAAVNGASVADPEGAASIVRDAVERFGRIDGVVNNAGILRDAIFHKMSTADFEAVVQVHLMGAWHVAKAAAPHFRGQGSGAYVFLTSTSGLIGNVGQSNYAAAKLGVAGLSRGIALDMNRFGVTSNAVAPFAWSRMIGSIPTDTPAQQERVKRLQEMTPDKIAPLAVYLLGAEDRPTGQIFGARNNELFVFSQPRPARSVHRDGGWTPEAIAGHAMPALKAGMTALEVSGDVFSWDPV